MKTKILLTAILLGLAATTYSQVIHVPADYPTIQAGIDAATNGDTVLVDTGTYVENINYMGKSIVIASHYILTGDTSIIDNTIIKSWDFTQESMIRKLILKSFIPFTLKHTFNEM